MIPGSLVVTIDDRELSIDMVGGSSWTIPVGPVSLHERELERSDRLIPEQLTNALGIVADHLDDVVRESPMVLTPNDVVFSGRHAVVAAQVELGLDAIPDDYRLTRSDADEVFRTLVAEPADERIHNPGLPAADVHTVIGALCCILSVMRRLELTDAAITVAVAGN